MVTDPRETTIPEPGEEEGGLQELEEMGLNGCWVEDFTKALDHLSPEAGGISFPPRREHYF